ncbi:MAG: drug:proton antiporter, partial [Pseudomonadota bacterium]
MADEESRHVRVIFTPSGKQADVPADMTVLQAARKLGVDLDSVCGGRGICGRCQIVPSYGHFAKFSVQAEPHNLTPFSAVEARYQQKRGLAQDRRLGCSCRLIGDMVIDVPETSQLHKQVVRKLAEQRDIVIDPLIRLYYVEVDQPDMEHPSGDLERLYDALFRQWSLEVNNASAHIPAMLQAVLRKSDWCVTVAVRRCSSELKIIAIWPGLKERILGVAVDVGSTTMSAHLCDLLSGEVIQSAGSMNPQIRFGEDLMSRVSYAMMNPGGEQELTAVVQDALGRLIIDVCEQAACDRSDVLECVIVGNPVMHHLLLGWSPV